MEFRKSFSKEIHFQKKSIPWKLKDLKTLKIRLSLLFQIRSGIPQHQRSKRAPVTFELSPEVRSFHG